MGKCCVMIKENCEVSAVFLPEIKTKDDIVRLIGELGFLPYFKGEIPGFSIEENIRALWGTEAEPEGPWEWKGPIIREARCAYGKFYRGRAMYISRDWFPDFANYRRDGYDYDARVDDGLARRQDERLMEVLSARGELRSRELKALTCLSEESRRRYDQSLTFLQMQGYVTTSDFFYETDRLGRPFGWGLAKYATPEHFFGAAFTDRVYEREPEESREKLAAHLTKLLPQATSAQIKRLVG